MTIVEAARKLRPGTAWNLRGDVLEQAVDGTPRVSIPTLAELEQCIAGSAYQELRREEYPTVGDQLDAIWKGGAAAEEMRQRVMAVKEKYPKGE